MLCELRVENLLLIERAELRLCPGLNVLTGETGAGKTVLAHALDLLLGGRARGSPVRPGATEAYVEGAFALDDRLRETVGETLPPDAEDLVLARRVGADGRTRAYLNGRAIAVGDLRDLATGLLTFYGQHEHRRLTLGSAQLEILDDACGPAQRERRQAFTAAHGDRRRLAARRDDLLEAAGSRERELDLLEFELAEIEAASPDPEEEERLRAQRSRLRGAEALRGAAGEALDGLGGPDGGAGAATALAHALGRLEKAAGTDPELDGLAERLRALSLEADDLAGDLARYAQSIESTPGRLEEVEDRLAMLDRLARKHGGSVEAVLAHAEHCRARRDQLTGSEESLSAADEELGQADAQLGELAAALGDARRAAAPRLAAAVRERLGELAMEDASFEVSVDPREQRGATGDEAVEFLLAANPGVAGGPLREIASGGELSRVMLALMGVAAESGAERRGEAPLLVFDEVDAGIGGHTARAVGERLRALAAGHQVLCITHLPQVASLAERHFRIVKETGRRPARASVNRLDPAEVEVELVRMLGAQDDDAAARRHARQLLAAA